MLAFGRLAAFALALCMLLQITAAGAGLQQRTSEKELEVRKDKATNKGNDGKFDVFSQAECKKMVRPASLIRPVDLCFGVRETLRMKTLPRCDNGTVAKMARFAGKRCQDPLKENALVKLTEDDIDECMDTHGFESIAFWCDGFGDVDLSKKGMCLHKPKRPYIGMQVAFGFIVPVTVISLAIFFMWDRGLKERVLKLFGQRDGFIRL